MSAIVSLLRVMTLRDAEAITLESDRVPSLRRRGQVEALAMPALDAALLEQFAAPLVAGKSLDEGPLMVAFVDDDGATYPVTIEQTPKGLRIVARKPKPPAKAAPKPSTPPPATKPAHDLGARHDGTARSNDLDARPRGGGDVGASYDERGDDSAHGHGGAHDRGEHHGGAHADHDDGAARDGRHPDPEARARLARVLAAPVAIAVERGASDVFLSTGQPPRVRVDGRLEQLDHQIDDTELAACVTALGNADLSLELDRARVRVNAFDHLNGHAIAARLVRDRVAGLAELALPPELANIVELRDGLVLVCGPTGSGKSTTLAALIDLLDQRRAAHVITLEDPIEVRHAARRCLIHQRELGTHFETFAGGLRAALREAPDVILIGELRDRETLAAAMTAAETGHLVLATLHAPSAAGAVDRVIDVFPEGQQRQIRTQLAGALRAVVTQFLLPRKDGGRAPAIEYVPVTSAIANIIRKGDLHMLPTAIQSGRDAGLIPLERSLAKLVESGAVSLQAVKRIAADHDLLASLAAKLR